MEHGPGGSTKALAYLHALDSARISAVLRLRPVPSGRRIHSISALVVDIEHGPGGITEASPASTLSTSSASPPSSVLPDVWPSNAQLVVVQALELPHPKAFGSPISPKAGLQGMLSRYQVHILYSIVAISTTAPMECRC